MALFTHTFHYDSKIDLLHQMRDLMDRLDSEVMEEYQAVRARYKLKPAAFTMRLKRFKGEFPKVMGAKKILKLHVTPELHEALS